MCGLLLLVLACSEPTVQRAAQRDREQPVRSESPAVDLPEPMQRDAGFRRGLVLGPLIAPDGQDEEAAFKREHLSLLDSARALGATDLQLLVRWRLADERAQEVFPFDSVHDDLLAWLLEQARRRKLRVWLSPALAIEQGDELVPARSLAPKSWDAWWWSYRRFALHYARVAARGKVELLSVGVDLASTEGQSERWRKLIKEVRKFYRGKLTYAAGSDHFERISFWDELDLVAVSVEQREASDEGALLERLAPLRERLARSPSARELGYVISDGGCGARADAQRALLCHRALYQSFRDSEQLQGVFVRGALRSKAEQSGESASSGGEVVRHWYEKSKS